MSLTLSVLRTPEACQSLSEDWERLVESEGSGVLGFDVSATLDWYDAIWKGFLNEAPQFVLVASDASGVRGLLPCTISEQTIAGVRHRQLTLITGNSYELRTGFLVGGDAEVLRRLLAGARELLPAWDSFAFTTIEGGRSDQALQAVLPVDGLTSVILHSWQSAYIEVREDPTQVLMDIKSNMRTKLKRRDRELQALGVFEMRLYETPESIPGFLDLMLSVESRSWKQQAGTAMTEDLRQQRFYERVTPVLARRGRFLGAALWLDDLPLAFQYGFLLNGVYVGEKTSYDNAYRDQGVGSALTARLLAELSRRGVRIFDLAGVMDASKAQWTKCTYTRNRYLLLRPTWRGQWLRFSLALRAAWARWRAQARTNSPSSTHSPASAAE